MVDHKLKDSWGSVKWIALEDIDLQSGWLLRKGRNFKGAKPQRSFFISINPLFPAQDIHLKRQCLNVTQQWLKVPFYQNPSSIPFMQMVQSTVVALSDSMG